MWCIDLKCEMIWDRAVCLYIIHTFSFLFDFFFLSLCPLLSRMCTFFRILWTFNISKYVYDAQHTHTNASPNRGKRQRYTRHTCRRRRCPVCIMYHFDRHRFSFVYFSEHLFICSLVCYCPLTLLAMLHFSGWWWWKKNLAFFFYVLFCKSGLCMKIGSNYVLFASPLCYLSARSEQTDRWCGACISERKPISIL